MHTMMMVMMMVAHCWLASTNFRLMWRRRQEVEGLLDLRRKGLHVFRATANDNLRQR
jgi:hypothetical protein